jgi:uncharacterized protein (TIGR00251 family)
MRIIDYIKLDGDTWLCKIKVTPKQPKTEIFSVLDDWTVKIRLKAVPEKWKANKELISFLAKELWISKNDIDIIAWVSEQVKILKFKNLDKWKL